MRRVPGIPTHHLEYRDSRYTNYTDATFGPVGSYSDSQSGLEDINVSSRRQIILDVKDLQELENQHNKTIRAKLQKKRRKIIFIALSVVFVILLSGAAMFMVYVTRIDTEKEVINFCPESSSSEIKEGNSILVVTLTEMRWKNDILTCLSTKTAADLERRVTSFPEGGELPETFTKCTIILPQLRQVESDALNSIFLNRCISLEFEAASLSYLPLGMFEKFESLKTILLASSTIQYIENDLFAPDNQIAMVILNLRQLRKIPNFFKTLSNLELVTCKECFSLSEFDTGVFSKTPNMLLSLIDTALGLFNTLELAQSLGISQENIDTSLTNCPDPTPGPIPDPSPTPASLPVPAPSPNSGQSPSL